MGNFFLIREREDKNQFLAKKLDLDDQKIEKEEEEIKIGSISQITKKNGSHFFCTKKKKIDFFDNWVHEWCKFFSLGLS